MSNKEKKKIVLVSDSPYSTTGLGRVSKYFLKMLPEFEWSVWGFLHPSFDIRKGMYLPHYDKGDFECDFKLTSPRMFGDDVYGLDLIGSFIEQEKPDFLITSMDYDRIVTISDHIKQLQFTLDFKWINYFPADREDLKPAEIQGFRFPDVNICITKFGMDSIHAINPKLDIKYIHHAIDATEFPSVGKSTLKKTKNKVWPNMDKKDFFIGSINRSFIRKDTGRLVRLLSEYIRDKGDTAAYIHGKNVTFEGLDLKKLAFETDIPKGKLAFMPDNLNEIDGVTPETLNKIYRCFDLFLTVSQGEGFGYTTIEALLTETPIIAPHNTSFPELVQDFGYLVPTSEVAFWGNSNSSMWPVVNMEDVKDKIDYVRDNYDEAKEKARAGSKWVKGNLNLQVIGDQWREILK